MTTRIVVLGVGLAIGSACNNSNHEHPDAKSPDAHGQHDAAVDSSADETQLPTGSPIAIALASIDELSYTAPLEFGSQHQAVIVDTGSTTLGVASSTCANCSVSPLYAPGTGAVDQHQTASSTYADGTGWDSEVYQDTVALGGGPAVAIKFGAITSSNGFFRSFDGTGNIAYQGILGLGPDANLLPDTTSYLTAAFTQGTTAEIAFQLCFASGTMWLGGYDTAKQAKPQAVTPMVTGFPFYGVQVADMAVAGTSLGQTTSSFGPTIIDTGTSIAFIPTAPLNALTSAIESSPGFQAVFSGQSLSSNSGCVTTSLPAAQIDAMLPPIEIAFPGISGGTSPLVDLPATHAYLVSSGGGQWCFAFADSTQLTGGQLTASLFGDSLLNAYITTVDVASSKMGFALQTGCDEAVSARLERSTAIVYDQTRPWWTQDARVRYPSRDEMQRRLRAR